MKLPAPLRWLSLVGSLSLAAAPAVMGVLTALEGDYALSVAYLAVAVVVFAVPEYIERRVPGPIEVAKRHRPRPVAAVKRRLPVVGGDPTVRDDSEEATAQEERAAGRNED